MIFCIVGVSGSPTPLLLCLGLQEQWELPASRAYRIDQLWIWFALWNQKSMPGWRTKEGIWAFPYHKTATFYCNLHNLYCFQARAHSLWCESFLLRFLRWGYLYQDFNFFAPLCVMWIFCCPLCFGLAELAVVLLAFLLHLVKQWLGLLYPSSSQHFGDSAPGIMLTQQYLLSFAQNFWPRKGKKEEGEKKEKIKFCI